ncbi:hypothetical protein SETIT_3G405500v2 [Setaria italica]|uniref:Uncharacterized protein n=1 Tax=Setaria italica TaxID=4555 RepID=A0A368QP08_SETIT|nr:hypothetical protein SETIT_3G405500v2 [Setaria italica]
MDRNSDSPFFLPSFLLDTPPPPVRSDRILAEVVHLHISLSPSLPTEKDSPSSVLLDSTAYISAAAVSNTTTAVGKLSTGTPIQVSFCLTRPPRLSYICVHFPVSITWARV